MRDGNRPDARTRPLLLPGMHARRRAPHEARRCWACAGARRAAWRTCPPVAASARHACALLACARTRPPPGERRCMAVILAHMRQLPAFLACQARGHWSSATREVIATGRAALGVLDDLEARNAPFFLAVRARVGLPYPAFFTAQGAATPLCHVQPAPRADERSGHAHQLSSFCCAPPPPRWCSPPWRPCRTACSVVLSLASWATCCHNICLTTSSLKREKKKSPICLWTCGACTLCSLWVLPTVRRAPA